MKNKTRENILKALGVLIIVMFALMTVLPTIYTIPCCIIIVLDVVSIPFVIEFKKIH